MTGRPVRIFLSPLVLARSAPELIWTIETLFTGIGRPWHLTTDASAPSDVAYATADEPAPAASLRLRALPGAWERDGRGTAAQPPDLPALELDPDRSSHDPFAACYALMSGIGEAHWERDRHGHHLPPDGGAAHLPREAVVSTFAAELDRELTRRLGCPPRAPWPSGASFAAAATHDVDYPELIRWLEPLRIVARRGTSIRAALGAATGRIDHWHFGSWIESEAELGISSTFYFSARRGSLFRYARGTPDPFYDIRSARLRAVLGELLGHGMEVGLHASYRACERPGAIAEEKHALEEILGVGVAGCRHHYWRLDPDAPEETLLEHERSGLLYDASLAFERLVGWRRAVTWPFHPFSRRLRRPIATLQLQTTWMDDHVFGHAAVNGVDSDESRADLLDALVERAAATGGVFVTDVHDYVFDERLFPGWRAASDRVWQQVRARPDAWAARPVDVATRWLEHERRLRAESSTLA